MTCLLTYLQVRGGHGVARSVGVGEGVQKGVEGSLGQLDKGVLHVVLARAAQHRVLQDVGNARGILTAQPNGHASVWYRFEISVH